MMQHACTVIRDEFSNYSAKYNTPAKLNNFNLSMDDVEKLGNQIGQMNLIQQFVSFKAECGDIVKYISNIEFIDLGANFKSEFDNAKAIFRETRDSIASGTSG